MHKAKDNISCKYTNVPLVKRHHFALFQNSKHIPYKLYFNVFETGVLFTLMV